LSSGATSLTLKAGQGSNFPTYGAGEKSIGTIISYDVDGNVVKSERVIITANSGDVVTIER
jgi:hypothetical protein